MTDATPHRSRTAWPGPMSSAGVEPGHDHELPAPLVQRVRLLTRAVVTFGVCLAAIGTLLVLLISERGVQRDREQAELEREIRESWCLALDTFPAGVPSLERLRAQYDCGPGIPFDQLTPDEQARLQGRPAVEQLRESAVAPAAPTSRAPFSGGADGPAVRGTEPPAPTRPTLPPPRPPMPPPAPQPSPEPTPLVDVGPLTDITCDALGVCP